MTAWPADFAERTDDRYVEAVRALEAARREFRSTDPEAGPMQRAAHQYAAHRLVAAAQRVRMIERAAAAHGHALPTMAGILGTHRRSQAGLALGFAFLTTVGVTVATGLYGHALAVLSVATLGAVALYVVGAALAKSDD